MSVQLRKVRWTGDLRGVFIGLAISFQASVSGVQAAEIQRTCTVDAMAGSTADVAAGQAWTPITQGAAVPFDARVRTGPDTRLHLACDDGIAVTIGAGTEIELAGLVGTAGPDYSIGLRLLSGITGIVAPKRSWNTFEVATDLMIASVRSTEWLVQRNPDGTSAVFTRRGKVEVTAGGKRSSVGVGQGVTISVGAVAGPVKKWGAAKIAKADQALGFDWK